MADQAAKYGTPVYDECDEYDSKHGSTTLADELKLSGLTEASNKEAPHYVPFVLTTK